MIQIKMPVYYFLGSVVWFILINMMPIMTEMRSLVMPMFYLSFFFLTIGLFIGILLKDLFHKKPWLLFFLPVLQVLVFVF